VRVSPLVMVASALTVILPGCGSTEEQAAPGTPASPAPRTERPEGMQFRTRADTVTALHAAETGTVGAPGKTAQVRFMVQIGAFKDPKHASAVQAAARKRYRMPVLNDYLAGPGLYQIRIGFFESRENARTFQQQMKREYQSEYEDSWIVQLKRQ
jgi:cell division septation protein DedD